MVAEFRQLLIESRNGGVALFQQIAKVAESKRTPKASEKTVPPIEVENARPPQAETKGGKIMALIGREQGASLTELREATGWQAHSVDRG